MQYYRHRLVSQVRCRWLGLLALVMQVANSSSNSLLKVMTTYICCLILCAQPAPGSCLHLGASVRGRLTSSSHAHVILKSQGVVDAISLLTARPSSWMQSEPFHSKEWPCYPAWSMAVTQLDNSWISGLQNCHTFTLSYLGPVPQIILDLILILEGAAHEWFLALTDPLLEVWCWEGGLSRGSEKLRQQGTGWGTHSCLSHCSEELSLELILVGSAQCWALGAFVELSGTSSWKKGALKGSTLCLITPGVPVPGGDTGPAVMEDWPFQGNWHYSLETVLF